MPRPRGGRHSAVASSTLPPPAPPSPPTSGASVSRLCVLGYHVTALGGDLRDMPQTLCSRASSRAHTTRAAHPSVGRALLYALLHRQPTTLRQKLWLPPRERVVLGRSLCLESLSPCLYFNFLSSTHSLRLYTALSSTSRSRCTIGAVRALLIISIGDRHAQHAPHAKPLRRLRVLISGGVLTRRQPPAKPNQIQESYNVDSTPRRGEEVGEADCVAAARAPGRLEASSPGVPHRKAGSAWHARGAAHAWQ